MRRAKIHRISIAFAAACVVLAASASFAENPPAGKQDPIYQGDGNDFIRDAGGSDGEGRSKPGLIKPGKPGGDVVVVPEPGTIALLGLGLASLAVARRKKNKAS
jgi:hypothetical protein